MKTVVLAFFLEALQHILEFQNLLSQIYSPMTTTFALNSNTVCSANTGHLWEHQDSSLLGWASSGPPPFPCPPPPQLSALIQLKDLSNFGIFILTPSSTCPMHDILSVFKSPSSLVSHKLISLALSPGNSPYIYVLLKQKAPLFISTFFSWSDKTCPHIFRFTHELGGHLYLPTLIIALYFQGNVLFIIENTARVPVISPQCVS